MKLKTKVRYKLMKNALSLFGIFAAALVAGFLSVGLTDELKKDGVFVDVV